MRLTVVGAGAIGGSVGMLLSQSGYETRVVAKGESYAAIKAHGLQVTVPSGDVIRWHPEIADRISDFGFTADDVVVLAVKSQDSRVVLDDLLQAAPDGSLSIVCLQNGVANERQSLRRFCHVYGVNVLSPATHTVAGEVTLHGSPAPGILDIGRYPSGTDDATEKLARALAAAGYLSMQRSDIMRWKYRKLLGNLGNAIEALCGRRARHSAVGTAVLEEGEACLRVAGIDVATREEDNERRRLVRIVEVGGVPFAGGSTWQSLSRRTSVETMFLNGEIVLLGRLSGFPTPLNEQLIRLVSTVAARREGPSKMTVEKLEAALATALAHAKSDGTQ